MALLYHMIVYMGNRFMKLALDWIFPISCMICGLGKVGLCNNCAKKLPKPETNLPDWIFPLWSYKHKSIREMIVQLKTFPLTARLEPVGSLLYHHLCHTLEKRNLICIQPIIIPIPISPTRFRERGYNQSELIARSIIPYMKKSILRTDILYKIRESKKQALLHKTDRSDNAHDLFQVRNQLVIKNRDIILIDDVVTTGATLSDARALLLQNGARNVYAVTIAH